MTINNGEQVIDLAKALGAMAKEADMVCVVRCKDCQRNETKRCPLFWMGESPDDDGYCFMGERGEADDG